MLGGSSLLRAEKTSSPASNGFRVTIAGGLVLRWVRTYHEALKGELIALVSSAGLIEVAEEEGNAGQRLSLEVEAGVQVTW